MQVEAGGLKTIKLKLSPKFVKSAQKRGIRKIKATLTINTVLGSGQRTTSQQQVTIVLPEGGQEEEGRPEGEAAIHGLSPQLAVTRGGRRLAASAVVLALAGGIAAAPAAAQSPEPPVATPTPAPTPDPAAQLPARPRPTSRSAYTARILQADRRARPAREAAGPCRSSAPVRRGGAARTSCSCSTPASSTGRAT